MKYLKLFENKNLLDRFKTYQFENKIKQNKSALKTNALNIKEVIHTACEFCLDESSHIFMFEISMVETMLGISSKSKATRGDIGRSLWHVDKGTFEWTKTPHIRINKALTNLKKLGIDWSQMEWNDISENILFGAIACKLVLLKKGLSYNTSGKLNSRAKRANYYAIIYNGKGSDKAEKHYLYNTIGWYNELLKIGAEYLMFRNKKYTITKKGLMINNKLV